MGDPASIDHIGVAGRSLSALEEAFRHIGFTVAPRCELVGVDANGDTVALGQVNSHLIFPQNYVELTAVEGDLAGHHLESALSRYSGLHIVVLTTSDATLTHAELVDDQLEPGELGIAGRRIDYPGGSGDARFRWFAMPRIEEAFVCYVEQLTPELVFDHSLCDHPNGATELAGVTICCQSPDSAATAFSSAAGAIAETAGDGEVLVNLPRGTLRYVTPDRLRMDYPEVAPPVLPWAAGFSVKVRDLEKTANHLQQANVAHARAGSRIWVEPQHAGGAIVEFIA
mgnify:CR=1 FL=1